MYVVILRLFALNYRFMIDKSLIELTCEIISVSITHGEDLVSMQGLMILRVRLF